MEMNYYHYTTLKKLDSIIQSGQISLATASKCHRKEKACAWVSTNELWENTASKIILDNFGNAKVLDFKSQQEVLGCARIQVNPRNVHPWRTLVYKANMNKKCSKLMELHGLKIGAKVSEWFGSLEPITVDDWIRIEMYDGEKWVECYRIERTVESLNAA